MRPTLKTFKSNISPILMQNNKKIDNCYEKRGVVNAKAHTNTKAILARKELGRLLVWKKGKRIKPTSNIETLIRWISSKSGPGGGPSIPVSGHRRISTVLTREKYERKTKEAGLTFDFPGYDFFG